jgi:hypothetical protein
MNRRTVLRIREYIALPKCKTGPVIGGSEITYIRTKLLRKSLISTVGSLWTRFSAYHTQLIIHSMQTVITVRTGNDGNDLSAEQVSSDVPAPCDDGYAIRPVATLHGIRVALLGCVLAPSCHQFPPYRHGQWPQHAELSRRPIMEHCLLCGHWNRRSAGYVVYLFVIYLTMVSVGKTI